jgi:hypothetical protein
VFVVDRSQLVGVISAFDLLRLVEQGEVRAATPAPRPARRIPVRKRAAAKPKKKAAKKRPAARRRVRPKR